MVTSLGFYSSAHDSAIFVKSISTSHIHYPLYVDDIIIIGNDVDGIAMLRTKIAQQFNVKGLGPLHYFLVIEVFCIEIEPLKVRHNITKLELTIPLLPIWCIDIDLSIQPMFLTLCMTWVH